MISKFGMILGGNQVHGHCDEGLESPLLVWTYNRRGKIAHLAAYQPEYAASDYQALVHHNDVQGLLLAVKHHLRIQKRQHKCCGQFVNLHRVRNSQGKYRSHLSLITLTFDTSNHLAFLFGVDYPAPPNAPVCQVELQRLAHAMRPPIQTITPTVERRKVNLKRRSDRSHDSFSQTWRCAGYIVSPSLFRMVCTDGGATVELSEKQSRFIALLLGTKNSAGIPVYVRRALTRRRVFATDPDSRMNDNDIDRLVKFFRKYFGHAAIGTKRGYGHILRADHTVCNGNGMTHTLSLLWRERSSKTASS